MLKLAGAVIVFCTTTWFGFHIASYFSKRPRQIRYLQSGIQLLETEIVYGATPLDAALKTIAGRIPAPVGQIFLEASRNIAGNDGKSTNECWQLAVEKVWPKTALRVSEKDIVSQLGQALGRSDRHDQQKHLRLAINHLNSEGQEAKEEQARYEKMCKSLGVLGGMLITLLMY